MPQLRRFWTTDRNLTALLIFLCLDLFLVRSLVSRDLVGRLLVSSVYSLGLIAGVRAVAEKARTTTVLLIAAVLINLTVRWLRVSLENESFAVADTFLSALGCTLLACVVLVQVFSEGPITSHRIQGAVAVYLLIGIAFSFLFELIDLLAPGAYTIPVAGSAPLSGSRSQFLYFSFVTLTTVGFGDITAVHPLARSLVMAEALVGQLYPTILLARLVSLQIKDQHSDHA